MNEPVTMTTRGIRKRPTSFGPVQGETPPCPVQSPSCVPPLLSAPLLSILRGFCFLTPSSTKVSETPLLNVKRLLRSSFQHLPYVELLSVEEMLNKEKLRGQSNPLKGIYFIHLHWLKGYPELSVLLWVLISGSLWSLSWCLPLVL